MPNNRQNIVEKKWLSVVFSTPKNGKELNKLFDLSGNLNTGSSGII